MPVETLKAPVAVADLDELQSFDRVRKMCEDSDVPQSWPMGSADVATALRSGGAYDVSQDLLESWARSKSVGVVPIRNGKFAWSPGNVLAAAALANAARRWLLDSRHIAKMTGPELGELQARAVGESVFSDLDDVDIQMLVNVIACSDNKDQRNILCLGLIAKLRKDGVVV